MKWADFWGIKDKSGDQKPGLSDIDASINEAFTPEDKEGEQDVSFEKELENPAKENGQKEPKFTQKTVSGDPRSVQELLSELEKVGPELRKEGNPDFTDPGISEPEITPAEPLGEPSGKNMRDAKAIVEMGDWGVSFGLSKWAKEPSDDPTEATEPYKASEVEKEDLVADWADFLNDAGVELPPWAKLLFTNGRVYGPKVMLSFLNRRLHKKLEKEFAQKRAEMKAEFEEMKKQFREELRQQYQTKSQTDRPPQPETVQTEPESFQKTTVAPDGSFVYEKQKVAAKYEEFKVRTDWVEPDAPDSIKNGPYVVALQAVVYEMISELKRGEKIILDLLRDNFSQDDRPIRTVFVIPEKGKNGRKSAYERALLAMIGDIRKELRETAKKISILKNSA